MSLPIVLEIAIGLIFVYLTLSLVASEIQEILSAVLQWRAEHLKRSIEQLLAGDELASKVPLYDFEKNDFEKSAELAALPASRAVPAQFNRQSAITFANRLYSSPLIEDLNYEAQGRAARWIRGGCHIIGAICRAVTFSRNVFGDKTSGPSYIPAEAFATSLIDRLKLADFQWLLMRSRFSEFVRTEVRLPLHNMVNELRARLSNEELLMAEMTYVDQTLNQIVSDLGAHRLRLESSLEQIVRLLQAFETMADEDPSLNPGSDPVMTRTFLNRVRYLRNGLSYSATGITPQNAALIARLRPSLVDLAALLDPQSDTYAELVALAQQEGGAVLTALNRLQQEVIPPNLRASLTILSRRAESRLRAAGQTTGAELQQLQTEVETWFNHAMDRASGVYRRNVKGVGLLIGLLIAFTVNADTLYMVQRLSTDPAIRSSIMQTVEQIKLQDITDTQQLAESMSIDEISDQLEGDLRSLGLVVEEALSEYPLPIGRTEAVLKAQKAAQEDWPIPLIPQRLVGWAMTAVALSMGASFWFDLLRKVMSVRASGNRP